MNIISKPSFDEWFDGSTPSGDAHQEQQQAKRPHLSLAVM